MAFLNRGSGWVDKSFKKKKLHIPILNKTKCFYRIIEQHTSQLLGFCYNQFEIGTVIFFPFLQSDLKIFM